MGTSVFEARIVGSTFAVVGLGLVFSAPRYRTMIQSMSKDLLSLYLGGILATIMGLLIIASNNTFIILMLIGYAVLLKGAIILIFPDWTIVAVQRLCLNENLLRIAGFFCFALGLYISSLGLL